MPRAASYTHRASIATAYIRIPRVDWPLIKQGHKTEFRISARRHGPAADRLKAPCPIVGFSFLRHAADAEHQLFVVEECWREPLGSISPESLEREGFESIREFRVYWRRRHQSRGYRALSQVDVFRVRPWQDGDMAFIGEAIVRRLYGPFIP